MLALLAVKVLCATALDLTLLHPAALPGPPVIAVLPFDDFSPPEHHGHLSVAFGDNITALQARYPQFLITPQRLSSTFRNSDLGTADITERLGADFVLEGSRQYDETDVRTTARLTDGVTDASLWAV